MEASQHPGDQPAQSQQEPTTDSNLQTPQSDQPAPSEAERTGGGEVRENELAEQREEHNERAATDVPPQDADQA